MFFTQVYKIRFRIILSLASIITNARAQAQHRSWINHHIHPDPRWQLYKEQPTNYLQYRNFYQIPTSAPLTAMPAPIQRPTATPEIVQRQRHEGNFYRSTPTTMPPTKSTTERVTTTLSSKKTPNKKKIRLHNRSGYAAFEHKVIHVTTPTNLNKNKEYRRRRSFQHKAVNFSIPMVPSRNGSTEATTENSVLFQQKHFHDIFMHFAGPQNVAFGHTEMEPGKLTQRFESLNKGNRYRGEVTWHDARTGGYGTQHWDLAQGSLQHSDHRKPSENSSSIENQ